jgi:rod shape determining protein RodA
MAWARGNGHARLRSLLSIDWFLFGAALLIALFGLATMHSYSVENAFFERQAIWIAVAIVAFFVATIPEYSFLRRTPIVVALYSFIIFLLAMIFLAGSIILGSQQRFDLGIFFVQPSDPAKLILILVLAKYFARRHVEIAHYRHIFVSGAYAGVISLLVLLQPDFGGALIMGAIWLGMVLVAGISRKHLAFLGITALLVAGSMWVFVLADYQKARIMTFIHPLADIQDTGYNAYQSTVAVGSGEIFGKGIGFGTQSKLQFLPEFQTDFIFAAYAEEWGFIGVLILFGLFAILFLRILSIAAHSADNFDSLLAAGIAIHLLAQFAVHVGMNMGLLPITGTTLPFMSYGGSHLVTEFAALGFLMSLRRRARPSLQGRYENEIVPM